MATGIQNIMAGERSCESAEEHKLGMPSKISCKDQDPVPGCLILLPPFDISFSFFGVFVYCVYIFTLINKHFIREQHQADTKEYDERIP